MVSNLGPINDACLNAISLTVNPDTNCTTTTTGTTYAATQSLAGCNGTADDDVWYSFVATSTFHFVTATPGTLDNIVLQVYGGTCGSLTSISCRNATTGSNDEIANLTGLTVGNTYYVRVHSAANNTGQGTFSLCVTTIPNPVNNECAGAINLTVNPSSTCTTSTSGTTVGGTQSQAGCSGAADDDVWFSFVATTTNHTVTVTPGTLNDAVLQVFSGSCGSLTSISCRNATTGSNTEVASLTGLTAGNTYYVRLHSSANGTGKGSFSVCVTTFNDNCSGAYNLTVNPTNTCTTSTFGTTNGATQSQAGCSGTAEDDVWYSFVATSTNHIVTVSPSTLYDAVLQVFSGSCGSLTSIICRDITINYDSEVASLTGLTIGNTYYVRVYGYFNGFRGDFSICVTTPANPCDDIINISSCGEVINQTVTSGYGIYSSTTCGNSTPGIEYLYSFTPTVSGTFSIQQLNSYNYIDYQYKNASTGCNSSDWMCIGPLTGAQTSYTFYMSAGVQYYIMIDPLVSGGGNVNFSIIV